MDLVLFKFKEKKSCTNEMTSLSAMDFIIFYRDFHFSQKAVNVGFQGHSLTTGIL